MSDADTSAAAAQLARARWGDSVVRRAVETVVQRADQLDDGLRAELQAVVSGQDGGNDG
jgi:hypothetical protein